MSEEPCQEALEILASAKALLMGASDNHLIITLHRTLKEFFDDSNCWTENIGVMVVPNTLDYQIRPITGEIIRLQAVIDQNNVLQAAILNQDLDTLHFLYPYNNVQPMTAIVSKNVVSPYRDGKPFVPFIPKEIYRNYGIGILDGLIGWMMSDDGQSYSNPQKGMGRLMRFRNTIAKARTAASHGNVLGGQSWAYPQGFRVTSQKGGVSTFNMNPSPITAR